MTIPTGNMDDPFETYERIVFQVRAVRLTDENMDVVANKCAGSEIKWTAPRSAPEGDDGRRRYIQLPLVLNASKRQLQGFVGDWVVDFDGTYKVFGDRVYRKTYRKPEFQIDPILPEGEGEEGGVVSVPAHNCCIHLHMPRHPNAQTIPFTSPQQNHLRGGFVHRIAS